jgi:hypothetical protein
VREFEVILDAFPKDGWLKAFRDVPNRDFAIVFDNPRYSVQTEETSIIREEHDNASLCIFLGHVDGQGSAYYSRNLSSCETVLFQISVLFES